MRRLDRLGDAGVALGEELVNGHTSKRAKPHQAQQGWEHEHTGDKLAHRAPLGNAGDKRADKRRPCNPPRPIKRRPSVQKGRVCPADPVA